MEKKLEEKHPVVELEKYFEFIQKKKNKFDHDLPMKYFVTLHLNIDHDLPIEMFRIH